MKKRDAVVVSDGVKKKKRKRSCSSSQSQLSNHPNTLFALLLASLSNSNSNSNTNQSFIKKCLFQFHPSLLLSNSSSSVTPILALLPTLLSSTHSPIARRAADITGAASLVSLEINEEIATDSETIKGLISLLENPDRKVLSSACNAILDLSTTAFAQQQLLNFSALHKLMSVFLQVFKRVESVCLLSEGNQSFHALKIGIREDELSVALLSAIIVLINVCNVEQLHNIPESVSEAFLSLLKEIRANATHHLVIRGDVKSNVEGRFCKSNVGVCDLADSIFRLSINASQLSVSLPFEVVQRGLFGTSGSSFEDFLSNHWEVSPFLLSRTSEDHNVNDMFSPFIQSLNWNGSVPSLLHSILQDLVSCFPIASEEQNILNFLIEVKDRLGCPIIYQQDIRVVKADSQSRKETHYFHPECHKEPLYFTNEDVLKCEQAYKEGYTVALRGLEFRYQRIASIADTLALMFGQPSVGANLYLTPANSQGLARHFDDHCVFVCQIFGSKKWTVFSRPGQLLPRLYDSLCGSDVDCTKAVRREFFLKEGDVLYIPRGFPHEAYTNYGVDDGSPGFSLHLTLSIEVEPAFEWEGVAHFALHCWNENQRRPCYGCINSLSQKLDLVSVNLLHVAIGIICTSNPTFRKACLTAAVSLPPDVYHRLIQKQRTTFLHLVDRICNECRFSEVLSNIEVAIQKNKDPFEHIRWLQVLRMEKEARSGFNTEKSFNIEDLCSLCTKHKDKLEAAFLNVKSRFCSEVVFEDVVTRHMMLLQKYKKTRRQYINGMLSLHEKL